MPIYGFKCLQYQEAGIIVAPVELILAVYLNLWQQTHISGTPTRENISVEIINKSGAQVNIILPYVLVNATLANGVMSRRAEASFMTHVMSEKIARHHCAPGFVVD
jgi:hypothetical protein